MESAIAGTVLSVADLVGLFSDCTEAFEVVSSAADFGANQEILQVRVEVERVRLLVWGQFVGIATIVDDWFGDGSLDVDKAVQKDYIRSAIGSLLACFIEIFQDVKSLERDYGLAKKDPTSGWVVVAGGNSPKAPVLESVFQRVYAHFQENVARNHNRTPEKQEVTWTVVDEDQFRGLIKELKGINDSLYSLLPGVQQRIRVQLRSEIMRSKSEQQLQSLVSASEDVSDFISETASLRLEMLSNRAISNHPAPQETQAPAVTPFSTSPPFPPPTILPLRPDNPQSGREYLSDTSRSPPVGLEPVIVPFDDTGALVIQNVFLREGCLSCFTALTGIEDAPELSKTKSFLHPSMEFMYVPETLCPIMARLMEMDMESDPKYAGWAPASVSVSGFGREFTQWNAIDIATTELPWCRTTPNKSVPRQTIVDRWKEITKYGLGQEWTEEKGREQVNEILGPSDFTWIDPNENNKIRHQISDLLGSLSSEDAFPNLQMNGGIGQLAMNDKINPNTSYHTINFMFQMLQAKEISLRLLRDNGNWHGGITCKVLYDMIAAELWMRNLEESKTGGFQGFKSVKDSQMRGIIHLAEELQWPFLSEVRELAQHILDNEASNTQVDIRVWEWMMGLVLPGGFFALVAFWALHNMSRSIKNYPPSGNVKVRLGNYGFSFPKVTYWRSRSIVGRVLAPLAGVKDIAGWIGPCPCLSVSGPYSINGTLIALQYLPPSFTLQEDTDQTKAEPSSILFRRNTETLSAATAITAAATTEWEEPFPPPPSTSPCRLQGLRLTPIPAASYMPFPSRAFGAPPPNAYYIASLDFQLLDIPHITKTLTLDAISIFISAPACRRQQSAASSTKPATTEKASQQSTAPPPRKQNHRIDPKSASLYSCRRVLEIPDLMMGDVDLMPGEIAILNATAEGGEVLARAWCAEKGCCAVVWKAPREEAGEGGEDEGEEGGGGCFKCALMMASKEGLDVGVVICC